MVNILLVGLGGFFGAISRYKVGQWVHQLLDKHNFPYGTIFVNILGCFLIGLIAGLVSNKGLVPKHLELALITGFLGGFTTFSSFSLESLRLMQTGNFFSALLNIVISVVVGLTAAWLGMLLSKI
jgi:fluoride exporter